MYHMVKNVLVKKRHWVHESGLPNTKTLSLTTSKDTSFVLLPVQCCLPIKQFTEFDQGYPLRIDMFSLCHLGCKEWPQCG